MHECYGLIKDLLKKTCPNTYIKKLLDYLAFKIRKIGDLSEVYYWDNHLSLKYQHKGEIFTLLDPERRKDEFPMQLLPYIYELRNNNGKLRVLEVGSGPLSNLAWGVDQDLFQLTAIDPLAKQYNLLIKKNNYSYPIKPIKGYGERLLKLFEKGSFDIVYSKNAIDHSSSPKKCIDNMYHVLKEKGIIFLEGNVKEGTAEGWKGLHQHDLIPENGQLAHYGRKGKLTNLTEDLSLQCVYQNRKEYQTSDWYIIIFRKRKI